MKSSVVGLQHARLGCEPFQGDHWRWACRPQSPGIMRSPDCHSSFDTKVLRNRNGLSRQQSFGCARTFTVRPRYAGGSRLEAGSFLPSAIETCASTVRHATLACLGVLEKARSQKKATAITQITGQMFPRLFMLPLADGTSPSLKDVVESFVLLPHRPCELPFPVGEVPTQDS